MESFPFFFFLSFNRTNDPIFSGRYLIGSFKIVLKRYVTVGAKNEPRSCRTSNWGTVVHPYSIFQVVWPGSMGRTRYGPSRRRCPKCFKCFKSSKSCCDHRGATPTRNFVARSAICRSHQKGKNVLRHLVILAASRSQPEETRQLRRHRTAEKVEKEYHRRYCRARRSFFLPSPLPPQKTT